MSTEKCMASSASSALNNFWLQQVNKSPYNKICLGFGLEISTRKVPRKVKGEVYEKALWVLGAANPRHEVGMRWA